MPQNKNTFIIVFFILIGIGAVTLGFLKIKGAIYAPFISYPKQKPLTQEEVLAGLKVVDTDKDGISNFDEQFKYRTSAYLADSDSDGYSDKQEIDAQSDPLNLNSTPLNKLAAGGENTLEKTFSSPSVGTLNPTSDLSNESVQKIRDLLVDKGGLSRDVVDKLDSETLQKLYNETKAETGIDLETIATPNTTSGDFSDLDINELRQLLIVQGADQEILNKIDDETLRLMFLQSVQESQ
ncbi:MAG: thrombospondin type 3 repeat-containing protein [Patescibacteria group bacterium]